MIYAEWLSEWLEGKRASVKPATYSAYANMVYAHIIPSRLGNLRFEEINEEIIQSLIDEWKISGNTVTAKGLSNKTIKELVGVIKQSLRKWAKKSGGYLIALDDLSIPTTTVAVKPEDVLNSWEQEILIKALFKKPNRTSIATALGLLAGLRIGEVCALRWNSIDWNNLTIRIDSTVQVLYIPNPSTDGKGQKVKIIGTPKTESSVRSIPISQMLLNLLFLYRPADATDEYILTGSTEPASPNNVRQSYYTLLRNTEIRKVKFHILRHTFGTKAITCGIDPVTLSMLMGHSSPSITMKLYCHPQMDDLKDAIQKLEYKWNSSIDKTSAWGLYKN